MDDAVSDIRYEAVFPHYMFVPNLRVTEHDDGSRSNLQGVLLLVATALSGLETSGEVRDGPELNRLLTSARDTEAYHSALHKLSVLLFGMSPAKVGTFFHNISIEKVCVRTQGVCLIVSALLFLANVLGNGREQFCWFVCQERQTLH